MSELCTTPVEEQELSLAGSRTTTRQEAESLRRHRILFVVESGTDVRLVEGLHQICDLSILARKIEGGREISQTPAVPVTITVGPSSRASFAKLVFRTLLAKRHQYDACIVQGYGLAALAANCAAGLTRIPTLMVVCSAVEEYYRCRLQANDDENPYRRHEFLILSALARLNARTGGRYIVLSRHLENVVHSHGTHSEVQLLPLYGVDTGIFAPSETPRTTLKRELGLPTTGSLLFCSSRVAPEKDTSTLLQAIAQLRKHNRDIWLLSLTGRHQKFQTMAARFGVGDRVIVADAVHPTELLPAYYQAADVCVQVSRAEGLGFSPLEALACGTPVVATAVGGLRETIIDGLTGWTHECGNPKDLALKIAEALDQPEEAKLRALNGRDMVRREYESSEVFRKLAQYVDKVVEQSL